MGPERPSEPGPAPRVVLVETAAGLPGLLPFQAWDAMATAETIYVRDPSGHPAAEHLHFAGLDLVALEPATLARAELDLSLPGDPHQRRMAKALLEAAVDQGRVVYLLGPDDEGFQQVVSVTSPSYDAEVEIVFLVPQPRGTELLRLVEILGRLRDPAGGCPWDLEQDHASLAPYLLEEAYELLEAIEEGDDTDVAEELGDVLLQVVFHAQVAADRRAFDIDDVARAIGDKLVRRHPHVFGDGDATTPEEVQANWDVLKGREKTRRTGPFDGIPPALPALMLAERLQRRAARRGFDWRDAAEPAERVRQELGELAAAATDAERAEELGDLLGAVVGLARHLGVDAEQAMRRAAAKFRRRFEAVLATAERQGHDPDTLDRAAWLALWEDAKRDGS